MFQTIHKEELKQVLALKGAFKRKVPITDEDLERTREEVGQEILREYGLDPLVSNNG